MPGPANYTMPMVQQNPAQKRRQDLATMMMKQGVSQRQDSPYGVLANMLNAYTGAKMQKEGEVDLADRNKAATDTMTDAMRTYQGGYQQNTPIPPGGMPEQEFLDAPDPGIAPTNNRQGMLNTMMQNPDTSGMASRMQLAQAMTPPSYKTATVGGAEPSQRQTVYYNPADPSQFKPMGGAYTPKAATEINMGGGQPPAQAADEAAQNKIVSEELGAPVAIRPPWSHIQDAKKRDDAKIKYGTTASASLKSQQGKVDEFTNTVGDIDRFLFLNKTNYTGKGMLVPGSQTARGMFDPEFEEMQSITDKMTPAMRNGLPGAASERDTAMFRSATVGPTKNAEANQNIGLGLKVAKQNGLDMMEYRHNYLQVNQHLEGSDTSWKQYVEANPVFDPSTDPGSYKLNEARISYKQYFALPKPTTPEDFSAIPKGGMFVDPGDGHMYRKQ